MVSGKQYTFEWAGREGMRISDHTILITSGAAGIGLALSRRWYGNGNRVIVVEGIH